MSAQRFDELKRHYRCEETFAALALSDAFPGWLVFEHPESAVDLAPDIVAGPHPGRPYVVVCVTRGSAQNAVQVKAWRDTYECLLYRRAHPQALLVRVVFGERGSPTWARAMERIFDVHVWIRDLPEGAKTEAFLHHLTQTGDVPPAKELWRERLPVFARVCLDAFAQKLRFGKPVGGIDSIGTVSTDLCEPFTPTALRRAVIIGALAGQLERKIPQVAPENRPELCAWRVCDARGRLLAPFSDWVAVSRSCVGSACFDAFVHRAQPLCEVSRQRLRAVTPMLNFFHEWYKRLIAYDNPPQHLRAHLQLTPEICAQFRGHPVLLALRYLLKTQGKDAFGHSRLLAQLNQGRDTHDLLRAGQWFSGKQHPPEHLPWERVFSWVVQAADILNHTPNLVRRIGELIFYDEAMKNPHVEPLYWLLQSIDREVFQLQPRRATFLDPLGRVGTVRCVCYGHTVFHWKSAYDGHRDKTKELAAKGMALRLLHPHDRYVLLLDGDFTERDVGSLAATGAWDVIVPVSSWNTEGATVVRQFLRKK